ncbi:beta-propeller domain-containing protein [Nonomuraea sp. NPDC050790]|uniref:beta-propeller domain-containing protein n=1 Tax=Nonomuraea sp. NPDC050790 TaxID=3364371 RepID=UPI0037959418
MKTLIRALTVAALATATAACTSTAGPPQPAAPLDLSKDVRLVSYTSCDDMLAGLRQKAAENVGPWGFGPGIQPFGAREMVQSDTAMTAKATPEHSTTNVHEAGVDEPDLVKTDGNRVFTVTNGKLRVIDTATKKVTAELELVKQDQPGGFMSGDLLISGDRVLVIYRGGMAMLEKRVAGPQMQTAYFLVDLSGEPKLLSTVRPQGEHVDARMVGSTVRIVTRSQPDITFPQPKDRIGEEQLKKINQEVVRQAPVDAWLPKIEITDENGTVRKDSVACERVSHPADYTGTSLLTVHSLDLAQGVGAAGTDPISLAADGDTVYGTGGSMYVASNPRWWWPGGPVILEEAPVDPPATPDATSTAQAPAEEPTPAEPTPGVTSPTDPAVTSPANPTATPSASPSASPSGSPSTTPSASPSAERTPKIPSEETEIHRFDIGSPGAPRYVASGKVPGRLLNQYSLSEFDGNLRVATTRTDMRTSASSVYVLKADTLDKVGEVGGLGKGERIYSVRFIGPVGYVVTFRQVDPLYTLDLRDPAAPRVTGELKITGYSAYLHPAGDGRLIGVGQEASDKGRTLGTQLSLFDVSDPAAPRRLSQMFQKDSGSEAEWDPHAFLYWPKTGLTVIPLSGYKDNTTGAMVMKVDQNGVTKVGMVKHPKQTQKDFSYQPGIQRAMVIGDELWTVSYEGVQVNDATSLAEKAWIPVT